MKENETRTVLSPVIKWSGSKRHIAKDIIEYFPKTVNTYYEPFIGGGSVLGRMLYIQDTVAQRYVAGDTCSHLICLWNMVQHKPCELIQHYTQEWERLQTCGQTVYYDVRQRFNNAHLPEDLLFLSRTCMNGLIRFNEKGEFNSSFHIGRPGIHPDKLSQIVGTWSSAVQDVSFVCADYEETTKDATGEDLVYLDPPYIGTKGMYAGKFDHVRFFSYLEELNHRGVHWVLSYDGKRGDCDMTADVPKHLYKRHLYLESGGSSFSRIKEQGIVPVKESLFLNY